MLLISMAGIYFHIPFCRKACHYCDFHFTTTLKSKDDMLQAMLKEMEMRKGTLSEDKITSIYFGGGTPSVLQPNEIQAFIDLIAKQYSVDSDAEITLEANPDDLEPAQVAALRKTQVNRFSIGIQSFYEEDLIWMNRAHNARQADAAIKRVQDAGFENITIDLIYGYPLLSDAKWQTNIQKALDLSIPHISAYSMTVEDKTALGHFVKKGKQPPMNEQQSAEQFLYLVTKLTEKAFEHYEISNFALPQRHSRHNTSYWQGVPYLGIGPSAHSFDGEARSWNIANNSKYIENINQGVLPSEREELSKVNRVNEYIMTSLRTMWGLDLKKVEVTFGYDYRRHLEKESQEYLNKAWLNLDEHKVLTLTAEGKLFADHIAAELFFDEK